MKLENRVTSLELSKKIKELGVKQESLFAWTQYALRKTDDSGWNWDNYKVVLNDFQAENEYISAFTIDELGEMINNFGVNFTSGPTIGFTTKEDKWNCYADHYFDLEKLIVKIKKGIHANTEANARAKCLIYLLENDLIKL